MFVAMMNHPDHYQLQEHLTEEEDGLSEVVIDAVAWIK
jgi:hypothetical protein